MQQTLKGKVYNIRSDLHDWPSYTEHDTRKPKYKKLRRSAFAARMTHRGRVPASARRGRTAAAARMPHPARIADDHDGGNPLIHV